MLLMSSKVTIYFYMYLLSFPSDFKLQKTYLTSLPSFHGNKGDSKPQPPVVLRVLKVCFKPQHQHAFMAFLNL